MKTSLLARFALTSSLLALLIQPSLAHRAWLYPSTSVLSGDGDWVTFDAAISNNLFFPNHHAFPLERVAVTGPDGAAVEIKNGAEGEYRTVFDVQLTQPGTYRTAAVYTSLSASWKEGGEAKRQRGSQEELVALVSQDKEELAFSENASRVESFVTLGAPSETALAASGKGLEIVFADTHPNDLFAEEAANFVLHFNGAPAANVEITVIRGDDRYRNEPGEIKVTTDTEGKFSVTWPEAGRYWINAETEGEAAQLEGKPLKKRASYTAVLEVLPA